MVKHWPGALAFVYPRTHATRKAFVRLGRPAAVVFLAMSLLIVLAALLISTQWRWGWARLISAKHALEKVVRFAMVVVCALTMSLQRMLPRQQLLPVLPKAMVHAFVLMSISMDWMSKVEGAVRMESVQQAPKRMMELAVLVQQALTHAPAELARSVAPAHSPQNQAAAV